MEKESIRKCIDMTQEVMVRHFHGDDDFVIGFLHDHCIWIGSCADEFYQGKERIAKVLKKEAEDLPDIELTAQEYMCATHDTHQCVITGRHIGQTSSDSGKLFRDMQRVTFVWKKEKGVFFIMHIHVSNPMNNLQKGENFPNGLSKYTKEYFNSLVLNDVKKTGSITVKDQQNRYQRIKISDIVYCEAFNMNCIIHLTGNDVFGRVTLLELENMVKGKNNMMFRRVHKSYLVNKYQVLSLERYEMTLRGGGRISVSKDRYNEVRDWLHS